MNTRSSAFRGCLGILAATLMGALPLSSTAYAQEMVEEESIISVDAGIDFTTAYFFRGSLQEDDGLIAQPWAELGVLLHEGADTDWLNSISATFGWWNSLHSKHTGTDDDGPAAWYETDLYAGLTFGLLEKWELGITYYAYLSPNSAFDESQEIFLSLGYDDSACWEALGVDLPGFTGLQPYVGLAVELDGTAHGQHEGVYLEIGIEPTFTPLPDTPLENLQLAVPVVVGLGLNNYYENDSGHDGTFGYVDWGFVLSHPIGEHVTISAGAHLLWLGDHNAEFNDGDNPDFEVVGTLGLSVSF